MRAARLGRYAVGLALPILLYFFAYGWRVEWDLYSGRERTVQCVFGIAVMRGNAKNTLLSELLNRGRGNQEWMEVASGPHYFSMVDYSYPRLLGQLSHSVRVFEILEIPEKSMPSKLADWVVEDLRDRRDCYSTWQRLKRFEELLFDESKNDDDMMLSSVQAEDAWKHSAKAP